MAALNIKWASCNLSDSTSPLWYRVIKSGKAWTCKNCGRKIEPNTVILETGRYHATIGYLCRECSAAVMQTISWRHEQVKSLLGSNIPPDGLLLDNGTPERKASDEREEHIHSLLLGIRDKVGMIIEREPTEYSPPE